MSDIDAIKEKENARRFEFLSHGITASKYGSGVAGSLTFHACELEKLLRELRRLKRLEGTSMTTEEARQEHAVITQAELDRLRAELAECRRLMRNNGPVLCHECDTFLSHTPDCPWRKAMGEA